MKQVPVYSDKVNASRGHTDKLLIMLLTFQTESNDESCYIVARYRLVTLSASLSVVTLSANFGVTLSGQILLHYRTILLHYQLAITLSVNLELHNRGWGVRIIVGFQPLIGLHMGPNNLCYMYVTRHFLFFPMSPCNFL